MFNFRNLLNRVPPTAQLTPAFDFTRMLNWKILRGSHEFPGPDGGTCINEAAIVAAGYPYRPVRRIDDCPASFSRPLALYAMCLNEIVLSDDLRQELLLPFVARLAGSADSLEVEMARVGLIIQRTVATILPEALERAGCDRDARRCRAAVTIRDAVAAVKQLSGRNWHARGPHLIGLINSISMAVEDHLAYRAVDAAQYAGTAIADVAELVGAASGADAAQRVETIYRRAAGLLDEALRIGNRAEPIAPEMVASRMQRVRQAAPEPHAA
ncbi:MAG TPA: hypothetical protein VH684_18000 [Xanthobacteraceae bacterium]|jgi:hypothetical protein